MDILGKLFGSEARVRLLRFFFLHPEEAFEPRGISRRIRVAPATLRKELALLQSMKIIKKEKATIEIKTKHGAKHKKVPGFMFNSSFSHAVELNNFLVSTDMVKKQAILSRFQRAGKIKLLLIAGVFIKDDTSRMDMLIVGDKLKRRTIDTIFQSLEAEAGTELRYAVLDTSDFKYRLEVHDRFIRDVLDYPHETVIDKLGIEA